MDTALSNEEMNWMKASKLIHNVFTEGLRIIFRREFERQVGIAWQDTPDFRRFVVLGGGPLGTFTEDIVPIGSATARKPGERTDIVLVDLDLTGRLKKGDLICVCDADGNKQFLRLSKNPTVPVVVGGVTRSKGKLQLNMPDADVLLPTVPRDVEIISCGITISTEPGPGVSKILCGNASPAKLATASSCEWDATALRLVLVGSTFAGRDAELLPMRMGRKNPPETNPAVIKAGWGKTHGPGDVVAHIMQAYRNDMVGHPPAGCAIPDDAQGQFPNGFNDLVEMMRFFAEHVVQADLFQGLIERALDEPPGGWTPVLYQQLKEQEVERTELAQSIAEVATNAAAAVEGIAGLHHKVDQVALSQRDAIQGQQRTVQRSLTTMMAMLSAVLEDQESVLALEMPIADPSGIASAVQPGRVPVGRGHGPASMVSTGQPPAISGLSAMIHYYIVSKWKDDGGRGWSPVMPAWRMPTAEIKTSASDWLPELDIGRNILDNLKSWIVSALDDAGKVLPKKWSVRYWTHCGGDALDMCTDESARWPDNQLIALGQKVKSNPELELLICPYARGTPLIPNLESFIIWSRDYVTLKSLGLVAAASLCALKLIRKSTMVVVVGPTSACAEAARRLNQEPTRATCSQTINHDAFQQFVEDVGLITGYVISEDGLTITLTPSRSTLPYTFLPQPGKVSAGISVATDGDSQTTTLPHRKLAVMTVASAAGPAGVEHHRDGAAAAPNQPPGTHAKDPRICYGMRGNSYQVAVTLAAALHARQSVTDGHSASFTVESEVEGLGVFDDVVIKITGKDGRCVEHCIQVKHHTGTYQPADLRPGKKAQLPAKKFFDSWSKLAPVGHSRFFYIVSTASPSPMNTILSEHFRTEHEDAPHLPFFNRCKSLRKASPDTMSDILPAADVRNEQQLRDFFEKAYRLSLENKEVDEYEIDVWRQFSKVYPDEAKSDTFLCLLMQVERWVRQVTSEGESITPDVLDKWVSELFSASLLDMLCLGKKAIFFPRVDFEDLRKRIKGFLSPDTSDSVMEVRGAPQSGKATAVVRVLRDLAEFARCTAVSGMLSPTDTSGITLATDIIIVCHCRDPRAWVQACRDGHYPGKKMIIVHSSTEMLREHSVVAQLDVVEALMGKVDRVQVTSSKWLSVEALRLMSGLGELTIAELERALGAPEAGALEAGAPQPKQEKFFPLECSLAVLKFDTGSLATVGLVVLVLGEPGTVVKQLAAREWHSHELKASTADVLRAKIDEMVAMRRAEEKPAHKFIVVACHSRVSEMVTAVRDARQHGVVVVLCADKQAQTGELPHDLLVLKVVDDVLTVVSGPAPPTASNWVSVGPSASPVYSVDQPCGRHIVVGGPGAGKSFLFAEMLAMWKSSTEPANRDSVWCAHVVLKDLRASVEEWGLDADASVEATVAFVVGHFIEPLPEWAPLATQDVRNGRAVYLLDGWDEMRKGDWSRCRPVLQFLSTQPHVLLSSRPSDLPGREVGVFLERRDLQPFSKEQVREYFEGTPGLENIDGLLRQLLERQAAAVVGIPLHCKVLKHVLTSVLQVGAVAKMDWAIVLSPAVLYKWYVASRCLNVDRMGDAIVRVDSLEPALLVRRERRCYWELRWLERSSLEFFAIRAPPDNERTRALTSLWPTGEEEQALANDAQRIGLLSEHLSYKEYLAARALVDAGRVQTVFADHKFERRLWGVWRFVARLCDGTGLNLAGMVNDEPTDCIGNCAGDLLKHIEDHIEVEFQKDNDAEEEHEMSVVPAAPSGQGAAQVNVLTAVIPYDLYQKRNMADELGEEKEKKAEAAAKLCQFRHTSYIICQSVCTALENLGVQSNDVHTHLMTCMTHTNPGFEKARAAAASAYLMLGYDPRSGHVVPAVNARPSAVSWSKLPEGALPVLVAPVQRNLQKGDTHPYLPAILTSSAAAETLGHLLADLFVGKDAARWRTIYSKWDLDGSSAYRLLHVWMTRECWQDQKEKLVQHMLQLSNKNALEGIVSVLIDKDCMTSADVDTLYSGRDGTGYWDTDAGWPCAALLDDRLTDTAMDYLRRSAEKWGLRQQFEFDALSPSAQRRLLVAVGSAVGEIPTSWMVQIDVPHFLQILSWNTRAEDEHDPLLHVVKHYANRHRLAVTVAGSTICLVADSSHRLPYAGELSEDDLLSLFSKK